MIIILVISTEATNIFTNYQRKGVREEDLEERSQRRGVRERSQRKGVRGVRVEKWS